MKSLYDLLEVLLEEEASKLSIDASRDIKTLQARVEHEGDSFFKIALPAFSKELLLSIERGCILPDSFLGFRRVSKRCRLPAFLRGWTRHMFDDGGNVRPDLSAAHLASLRLICMFNAKVSCEATPEQIKRAERKYVETDDDILRSFSATERDLSDFRKVAAVVISNLTQGVVYDYAYNETKRSSNETSLETLTRSFKPRHGPGVVAETATRGSAKYRFPGGWGSVLNRHFPRHHYAYVSPNHELEDFTSLFRRDDNLNAPLRVASVVRTGTRSETSDYALDACRVTFVPKTCKGPRTIGIEPSSHQFIQQGLKGLLYERIESSCVTRGSINFSDQAANQALARRSSMDRKFATLDLSDASDRVLCGLVTEMLAVNPLFLQQVMACRSPYADLPSGRRKELNKFASMGSALCFPIEALVFYCILQVVAHRMHGVSTPTKETVSALRTHIFVYGDDLIVPVGAMEASIALLHAFGLKVNRAKSFGNSYFRESCGVEYYRGKDVAPIYLRKNPFFEYNEPAQLISLLATCHQLMARGNFETVAAIRSAFETPSRSKILPGLPYRHRFLPDVPVSCGDLGWPTFSYVSPTNYDEQLQVAYIPSWRPRPIKPRKAIEGWEGLLRYFTEVAEPIEVRPDDTIDVRRQKSLAALTVRDRNWREEVCQGDLTSLRPCKVRLKP